MPPTGSPQPDRVPAQAPDRVPIRRALISVSDKAGIVELARALAARGVEIVSTGGTARVLGEAGIEVIDVATLTGFPEMMDGRVKTLHPAVHGGLLALRGDLSHREAMERHAIAPIDLLVVNLYPFEATVASGADAADCIETIDVGGPAMIRAAAKNHGWVAVVTEAGQIADLLAELDQGEGATSLTFRRRLAREAFARTAAYDGAIAAWMTGADEGAVEGADEPAAPDALPARLSLTGEQVAALRYGENPHQRAALYADPSATGPGIVGARQLGGKALSYNNIADADAALDLVSEFAGRPAVAIIKHANPCGVALGADLLDAWQRALACDPTSAFGGIVACSAALDAATAEAIAGLFVEVVIAPSVSEEAAARLAKRPALRLLVTGHLPDAARRGVLVRSVSGGWLVQERDGGRIAAEACRVVTRRAPSKAEMDDLLFAFGVAKHVKSNAIVFARGGATIGIGAGQMSRIDSSRLAAWKARHAGLETPGSVVASDAFFPFADGLEAAVAAGATAVIQPGGSMRDAEVIAAADAADLTMVFTGQRHFRH